MKNPIKQLVSRGRHSQDSASEETSQSNPRDTSPPCQAAPSSDIKPFQDSQDPTPVSHTNNTQIRTLATLSLEGKVALITGASKGIGKATAIRLAKDGARVVINYSSDKQAADEVVQHIGTNKAAAIQADAGKVSDIESLIQQTVNLFGRIDILIPCAGILPMSPLEATNEELFDKIFALNVKGPYFLAQVRSYHVELLIVF